MSALSTQVYIGLGSNNQHAELAPVELLHHSLSALADLSDVELKSVSSFYQSSPVGPQDQPEYVNAVASIETELEAEALLDGLQSIEAEYGRDRNQEQHWGQRTLDLDILLYGNQLIETDRLTIPHSQLPQRAFVLYPLAELAPALVLPDGNSLQRVIAAFESDEQNKTQKIVRIEP